MDFHLFAAAKGKNKKILQFLEVLSSFFSGNAITSKYKKFLKTDATIIHITEWKQLSGMVVTGCSW